MEVIKPFCLYYKWYPIRFVVTVLIFLIIIGIIAHVFKKDKSKLVFALYLVILLFFTVFGRIERNTESAIIIPLMSYVHILNGQYDLTNIIINVVMFLPLGFMLKKYLYRNINSKGVLFIAITASCVIEILQFVLKRGWFEVDDIIHNTVGAYVGFIIARIMSVY